MKTGSDHFTIATDFRKDVLTLTKEENSKSNTKIPVHRLQNPKIKKAYLEMLRKQWESSE